MTIDPMLMSAGVDVVRRDTIAFLKARVPVALAGARVEWGLTPKQLPDPVRYNEYEDEVVADQCPSICLSVGRARNYARTGVGPGAEQFYRVRYDVTVFAWLKAGAPQTPLADGGGDAQPNPSQRSRDRWAQMLTAILLVAPSLGKPGEYSLDEGTLMVSYSAASHLRGDRYLSGVSLTFDLYHTETLRRVPLGSVTDTVVEATVLVDNPD